MISWVRTCRDKKDDFFIITDKSVNISVELVGLCFHNDHRGNQFTHICTFSLKSETFKLSFEDMRTRLRPSVSPQNVSGFQSVLMFPDVSTPLGAELWPCLSRQWLWFHQKCPRMPCQAAQSRSNWQEARHRNSIGNPVDFQNKTPDHKKHTQGKLFNYIPTSPW